MAHERIIARVNCPNGPFSPLFPRSRNHGFCGFWPGLFAALDVRDWDV